MIYNCIKTTTTAAAIGTGNGTVVSAAAARARPLSDIPVGKQVALRIEDEAGTAWELSLCTVLSATTFSRDVIINGSAGAGQKVNFGAGAKTVQQVLTADEINSLTGVFDVSFSSTIPLARAGHAFMQQQTVSGPLTFTPAASAVRGALVYLRLVADGTNAPNFSAFKEWGGSLGYDNRAGIANQVQFFHDGVDSWVSISQAIGAAPAPVLDTTAPSMSGSISSSSISTSGFNTSWTAGSDNVGVTAYEHSIDGGATYTAVGNVLTRTVSGLVANTTYQVRVRALDAAGNRSAALSLAVSTESDAVVVPGDTTAPTMNGAITISNITQTGYTPAWPAASDAVGVAGYEFSRNAGTSYVDLGNVLTTSVTNATAGSTEQLRVRSYDAAGNRATPLQASVTMLAASTPGVEEDGRFTALDRVAEEGTAAPYGYYQNAGTAAGFGSSIASPGGMSVTSLPANADGFIQVQTTRGSQMDAMLFAKSTNALERINAWEYAIFLKADGSYIAYANGSTASPYTATARVGGDKIRLRRAGSSIIAEIERADGTVAVMKTWAGAATGQLFFGAAFSAVANAEGRLHTIRTKGFS